MKKVIKIDKKEVPMRASALVPRMYRSMFGRDIIRDINKLRKSFEKANKLKKDATEEEKKDAQLSTLDLMIFENVAYVMAKLADNNIPDTPEEWLDQFETFSIYQVFPEILTLWGLGELRTSKSKKK